MVQELLKNKKVAIIAFIFIILSVAVIVLAIFNNLNRPNPADISQPETSYDKATGETITTFSGYKAEDVMYVGFNDLLERGVTSNQLYDLRSQLKEYGKTAVSDLDRISYYKNSYIQIANSNPPSHFLKFALNNDKKDIYVKLVSKGIDNYEIILYSDEKMTSEVKKYSFCSVLTCPVEADPNNSTPVDDSGFRRDEED